MIEKLDFSIFESTHIILFTFYSIIYYTDYLLKTPIMDNFYSFICGQINIFDKFALNHYNFHQTTINNWRENLKYEIYIQNTY